MSGPAGSAQSRKHPRIVPANARLNLPEDNVNAYRGDSYRYRPWDSLSAAEQDAVIPRFDEVQ